jgi:spore maturation protein SpmA
MVLNYIWIAFIVVAFITGLLRLIICGDTSVFPEMMNSTFEMAKTGFELSLGITGVITLWMGIMKIGEAGGAVNLLAKAVSPLFRKLFPEVPAKHPANGSIVMNIAANMLGLDNAATPIGLKAMNELQELNPNKNQASNAQIMFMVLNASGLTIIPVSIMVYRAQLGAANPADIFLPILLATFVSTLAGIIAVSVVQRINLFKPVVLAYLGGLSLLVAGMVWSFSTMSSDSVNTWSSVIAALFIMTVIVAFVLMALRKRVNVYDSFIDGAKEGFNVAIRIIPYLIAILVAVGLFRASGAFDYVLDGLRFIVASLGAGTEFVDALPTALMKPLSGSGARGVMVETMKTFGADSFPGRLSCIFQGAADTTFYILAVYFGSVGVKNTRHALGCALIADLAGIIAAIFVAYLFFA